MAKKKSNRKAAKGDASPAEIDNLAAQFVGLGLDGPVAPARKLTVRERWDAYFGPGDLEDFQRLCADLRIEGDLSSKSKCRNVRSYTQTQACMKPSRTHSHASHPDQADK